MIHISANRLWSRLMDMAAVGATAQGGVCRLALSDTDKRGRDLFVNWCQEAGCSIRIDAMGNIFARMAGQNNDHDPILIGSHLDSQPTGGKFDGVYGVLAGLEVIETLRDHQIVPEIPIEIVSWTNEEGARFAPAMIGSGVHAGVFDLDYAYSRTDKSGFTLGEELQKIGYLGSKMFAGENYAAAFELHIEQGPILEKEQKTIGIVSGIQGIRWYDLIVKGKETHAGPTPMEYRADPVKDAIPLLQYIYSLADTYGPLAKVTVGYLDASPGVKNTVPGQLTISLDIRHPDDSVLDAIDADLKRATENIFADRPTTATLQEIWHSPPVSFNPGCVEAVRQATKDLGLTSLEMFSGAGHDSAYIARIAPTAMIFVPCKDGLSHNEAEYAAPEHVTAGCDVLLHAVLRMIPSLT